MHGFAGYFDTSLYDHIKLSEAIVAFWLDVYYMLPSSCVVTNYCIRDFHIYHFRCLFIRVFLSCVISDPLTSHEVHL